ncbi:hypothetical protein D3878_21690 [Noviherbaspirillum sedimenti]|uniref:MASE1 domain-containing protein n=2 Tax=Noviherbaspirillum sedimenti TaxID=2320865 RepID=A0A3A3GB57_9BURK|nr:hypothetical protein D3878_21690 [Noviherbaspirillum sedimenti]
MSSLRLQAAMVVGSAILFLLVFVANEWLFNSTGFEFTRGMNWIYLPAGMRLLCTLLFAGAGAVGILIASWITCIFYFFPDDPMRSFAGGIASAAAPYLVYKLAQQMYGLQASLVNLNAKRLLFLSLAYSVANPALHHLWLLLRGEAVMSGFFVMVLGDFLGTLVVLYAVKLALAFLPALARHEKNRPPSA